MGHVCSLANRPEIAECASRARDEELRGDLSLPLRARLFKREFRLERPAVTKAAAGENRLDSKALPDCFDEKEDVAPPVVIVGVRAKVDLDRGAAFGVAALILIRVVIATGGANGEEWELLTLCRFRREIAADDGGGAAAA